METMEGQVLPVIAHLYVDFIRRQPFVIIGAAGCGNMPSASILSGGPGFIEVVDERTLRVNALPDPLDPLAEDFADGCQIGLLLIDFATCRRLRLNGSVVMEEMGFLVMTRQVYANCPRYIQLRSCEPPTEKMTSPRLTRHAASLNGELKNRIGRADTFFIASFHPEGGADVSHRGGFPGFVQVVDDMTLIWPDYNGNGMFNTLGNILENSCCGLLFLDFENGGMLQLSGVAEIITDRKRAENFPGAERLVEFRIEKVVESKNATSLRWRYIEYSPDNPWFC
jgi:predicted pyridoxine 5'-phosphate oxidase superfamily flavin-nucleotide-binding protein